MSPERIVFVPTVVTVEELKEGDIPVRQTPIVINNSELYRTYLLMHQYHYENGVPMTVEKIKETTGLSSKSSAHRRCLELVGLGLVERRPIEEGTKTYFVPVVGLADVRLGGSDVESEDVEL